MPLTAAVYSLYREVSPICQDTPKPYDASAWTADHRYVGDDRMDYATAETLAWEIYATDATVLAECEEGEPAEDMCRDCGRAHAFGPCPEDGEIAEYDERDVEYFYGDCDRW